MLILDTKYEIVQERIIEIEGVNLLRNYQYILSTIATKKLK